MTLDEILECSAAQLEAMGENELLEHFKQYLNVTRPELAPRPTRRDSEANSPEMFAKKQMAAKLLDMGLDVTHLLKYKKKR